MKDCLWALRYLLKDNTYDWLEQKGSFLFKYFKSDADDTLMPCLKIILDISSGSEALTDILLENGVIDRLADILHHSKSVIRSDACFCLSNIAAGNEEQFDFLMSYEEIL